MSYVGNNPKFDSVILKDNQNAAVTNPPVGFFKRIIRFGKSMLRDSNGIETPDGGGGGGGRNYVVSPSAYVPAASSSALGWFTSGGTASTITAALPRESDASAIQFVSTTTGDYIRYRFKADDPDLSKRLQVLFSEIATFGDFKLQAFSGTDAALSSPTEIIMQSLYTNSSGVTNLPTGTADILANFDTTTRQYYEVRWTALAGGKTIKLSGVNIGAGVGGSSSSVLGSIPQPYTPPSSQGLGTLGTSNLEWRQVVTKMHIEGRIQIGNPTVTTARLGLPTGTTVGLFGGVSTLSVVGKWARNNTAAGGVKQGVILATSGENFITFSTDDTGNTLNPAGPQNASVLFANLDTIFIEGELIIPIAEWANAGSLTAINPIAQSPIRAGTIIPFAGSTVPAGWLLCDGTAYARDQYPQLFAQLGTTWDTAINPLTGSPQASPGATNFRVPNLLGAFLRNVGGPNAAGITTALAGFQADTTAKNGLTNASSAISGSVGGSDGTHTHTITDPGHLHATTVWNNGGTNSASGGAVNGAGVPNEVARNSDTRTTGISINSTNSGHGHTHSLTAAAQTLTGDAETRPDNVGVRHIIKAWDESFNLAGFANANANANGLVAPRKGQYDLTTSGRVTSSAAGWATSRGVAIYYQDQDSNHRLKFNLAGTFTTKTVISETVSLTGVTFKNISLYFQPVAGMGTGPGNIVLQQCYAGPGGSAITILASAASANINGFAISGDVELDSKPTWA